MPGRREVSLTFWLMVALGEVSVPKPRRWTRRSGTYPAISIQGWSKPAKSVMNGACRSAGSQGPQPGVWPLPADRRDGRAGPQMPEDVGERGGGLQDVVHGAEQGGVLTHRATFLTDHV